MNADWKCHVHKITIKAVLMTIFQVFKNYTIVLFEEQPDIYAYVNIILPSSGRLTVELETSRTGLVLYN